MYDHVCITIHFVLCDLMETLYRLKFLKQIPQQLTLKPAYGKYVQHAITSFQALRKHVNKSHRLFGWHTLNVDREATIKCWLKSRDDRRCRHSIWNKPKINIPSDKWVSLRPISSNCTFKTKRDSSRRTWHSQWRQVFQIVEILVTKIQYGIDNLKIKKHKEHVSKKYW